MGTKRKFITHLADSRIKRSNLIIRLTILVMIVIVLYDSYVFRTPLYYVIFAWVGAIVGKLFFFSHKVQINKENLELTLTTNRVSIVLLLLLIVVRFIIGRRVLESFHVIEISDALYLFFIGIYYTKWKVIINQIDELYYQVLANLNKNKEQ
jgi:Ca2+/Na+ antiporter